ncbi:MAG: HAMP domain-containing protein [Betaproteobacteria bacterium]|nr:HAMP domain-containing protein [Betaproteobacteria bacterium]
MRFFASRFGSRLSAKLIAGFLLVTVPALAVMVATSLYALRDLTSVNLELQEISRSLEAVQGLETAVARAVTPLSAYLVDGASGQDRRFEAAMREVEVRLKGCGGSACHGASRQSSTMAESLAPTIQAIKDRAAIVFGGGDSPTEQAKVRVLHEINQQSEEANGRLERMASTLLQRVTSLQHKSQEVSRRAETLMLVTASLLLALAALSAWLLSRLLLNHVGALLTGTRKIMQGELGYRVAVTQTDEIGQLARSFNAMAQEIQEHRENLERIVDARTAELRQAQDSLVQSEKLASIGLLAAGVAHELNNPLTSILMNVNLLMEDAGDQPALQAELRRISEDTVRCKRIIDDLRDFSRRHELDIAPTDLNALVRDALGLLGRSSELKAITVTTELGEEIPKAPCDSPRMEQVLANVLTNAVQAMPQGGRLTVATALKRGFAEISVQDTGPGIADKIRSRIFDPFFTTKPQGTGLGLSIVYRIMEAHGGRVEVESVAREDSQENPSRASGTRVILALPLQAAHPDGQQNRQG